MPRILFVSGSLRAASSATATARALMQRLEGRATTELAEIGTIPHYNADLDEPAAAAAFREAIGAADGVVFVTPEYNYSVPGVLKNAIDWASRPAYGSVFKGKPCLVMTVSGGALGGVRAQAHLKYVLGGMLAQVHPGMEVVIPQAGKKVEDGVLTDAATLDFAMAEIEGMMGANTGA
ncbi:NAD(P)H-dependent oxidoreductase [Mesobaculum littorinae]|uniref:NAD(P)H-dependent oxidoreductase n=1 Tax=Mesobaculum littorinae TaxID=2486419 RepID=A0A438AN56_9RHOB|nr:NAD(P)H-dependent oxidoreductase [Mesobaculum littorinae]RVV99966.1 NAD(P)H-dependent oxidoreductase [Mesobaculum littorinae]